MAFDGLLVSEIFYSLQGETSLSGVRFAFVRLTGCNLRCTYCDSTYAFKGGTAMSIDKILNTVQSYGVEHVLLTGGEPLLQRNAPLLAKKLLEKGYQVSIETHGEISIENAPKDCRIIMDIKTPSSKMNRGQWKKNLPFLKPSDEIKFIVASQEDYFWAKSILTENSLPTREVLFSPAMAAQNTPGKYEGVTPQWLADQILKDRLPVRLQIQLHKYLWGANARGV